MVLNMLHIHNIQFEPKTFEPMDYHQTHITSDMVSAYLPLINFKNNNKKPQLKILTQRRDRKIKPIEQNK